MKAGKKTGKGRVREYSLEAKHEGEENSILKGKRRRLNISHEQNERENKGIALRVSWLYDKLENIKEMLLLLLLTFLRFSFS